MLERAAFGELSSTRPVVVEISSALRKDMSDERVLVVPAAEMEGRLEVNFSPGAALEVIELANRKRAFVPRSVCETDESTKQIIPYVCIRHGDNFLLLERLKKQTEARLHNKLSLGIGGHINDEEKDAEDLVAAGLKRELNEEITVEPGYKLEMLGTIYDPASAVGRVHFGVAYALETISASYQLGEPDMMTARWVPRAELSLYRDRMEGWSQILFDHYILKEFQTGNGGGTTA